MEPKSVSTGFDGLNMPYSLEAEQAVLGCILLNPQCLPQVQVRLKPEHFYMPQHKAIYSHIIELDTTGTPIDAVVLLERLKNDNVYDQAAGRTYLVQLSEIVPSTRNVESYCDIVRNNFFKRSLIIAGREMIDSAASQDNSESADLLIDAAEQRIYDIRRGKEGDGPSKVGEILLGEVCEHLKQITSTESDQYKGLPTGFSYLDSAISGLNKSDLIIVGARPAMGKTSFALNLSRNISLIGRKRVVMFSLEMTKAQLAQRVLATEARVDVSKMRSGDIGDADWQRLGAAIDVLNKCELYFDDTSGITVPEMKARIRRMKDVDCVVIDYLGLISSDKRTENRVQEVSEITRNLKMMAKDLNIPIVCCSQLARATEGRGKQHRPQLSDLRESGTIEQDADIVLMLYRPYYYVGEKDDPASEEELAKKNDAELIIAKNRHGPTDTVYLHWNPDYTLFTTQEKVKND